MQQLVFPFASGLDEEAISKSDPGFFSCPLFKLAAVTKIKGSLFFKKIVVLYWWVVYKIILFYQLNFKNVNLPW